MTPRPHVEDVLQLPVLKELAVAEGSIDENGHMNVSAYFWHGIHAVGERCAALGFGVQQIATESLTTFTAEQHLVYVREMVVGQRFSTHARLIERSRSALHAMSFLVCTDPRRVVFFMEAVVVQADMRTRRSASFPAGVAAALDAAIAADRALPWPAPLSGGLGIRTPVVPVR